MDSLNEGRTQRYVVSRESVTLSFANVISLWRDDASFRSFFIALLAESSFVAFRWETPCVTSETLDRDFEFVLLRSDSLARDVDATAFADHFRADLEIVTFPNFSGDAVLVIPCPTEDVSFCGHVGSFIRKATDSQLHQLWSTVADAMAKRISDRPVWLSAAGMGVSWLHVRLDDRPKYYGYAPYRMVS